MPTPAGASGATAVPEADGASDGVREGSSVGERDGSRELNAATLDGASVGTSEGPADGARLRAVLFALLTATGLLAVDGASVVGLGVDGTEVGERVGYGHGGGRTGRWSSGGSDTSASMTATPVGVAVAGAGM